MTHQTVRLQMGKNGLTSGFIEQARRMFETEKVVKITLLRSSTRDRTEAKKIAAELASALGPTFKYVLIGYTITLRRGMMPATGKFKRGKKSN